jgi:hypothetical protein
MVRTGRAARCIGTTHTDKYTLNSKRNENEVKIKKNGKKQSEEEKTKKRRKG